MTFNPRPFAILQELDSVHAPDSEYRTAFSTGSKVALRRGESWRSRLAAWSAREHAKLNNQNKES